MEKNMMQWFLYTLAAAMPAAAIGGYYQDGIIISVLKGKNSLKPRINPKDSGRVFCLITKLLCNLYQ